MATGKAVGRARTGRWASERDRIVGWEVRPVRAQRRRAKRGGRTCCRKRWMKSIGPHT